MAANMFDKMHQRNGHRIIAILVYAFLEWILILLLFLNSFLSFLVAKFADYFGLKPFCTFCSRLDHIWGSKGLPNLHLGHVCEAHGAEISRLSYCFSHQRLAVALSLCGDCSFSRMAHDEMANGISSRNAYLAWASENRAEYCDSGRCSCCDKGILPSGDVVERIKNGVSIEEVIDADITDQSNSLSPADQTKHDGGPRMDFECNDHEWGEEDESAYITDMLLQNAEYVDSDQFICIELNGMDNNPSTSPSGDAEEERKDNQPALLAIDGSVEAALLSVVNIELRDSETNNINVALLSPVEESKVEAVGIDDQGFPDKQWEEGRCLPNTTNESLQKLHEKLITLEKVESGVEDLFKGSVVSGLEVENESFTIDHLIFKVKAQEKALNALHAELNEERKAAAEALQYQQMMEEQAEYDQEALQLLNDLMIKREKEKQELEKELEMYRTKVSDYEAQGKIVSTVRNQKGSCSSIDLDLGGQEDDAGFDICPKLNMDEVFEEERVECINDISLEEFDEERLSILEELKAVEAKLLALYNDKMQTPDTEEMNKAVIQDELSHAYERLQALEADKDFLKHCISTMMKGSEGLTLLQEILQHLHGLRSVEFPARNSDEIPTCSR